MTRSANWSCVVPHDGAVLDETRVRRLPKEQLASYKVPRRVLFFCDDELAKTGSAKIKTADLRKQSRDDLKPRWRENDRSGSDGRRSGRPSEREPTARSRAVKWNVFEESSPPSIRRIDAVRSEQPSRREAGFRRRFSDE